MLQPSQITYEPGDVVELRRGRRPRSQYRVERATGGVTKARTPLYLIVKISNGFPTIASAADIQKVEAR